MPDSRALTGSDIVVPTTVRDAAQQYMDHLKIKTPNRNRKLVESPSSSDARQMNNPAFLHNLPLTELIAMVKQQEAEICDLESKIYTATERHYFGMLKKKMSSPLLSPCLGLI
jgi:hypothetical protein